MVGRDVVSSGEDNGLTTVDGLIDYLIIDDRSPEIERIGKRGNELG